MTRGSIQEYTEAVRGRYLGAAKKEKGRILDEFTQVTGYHRKAAVRLLRRGKSPRSSIGDAPGVMVLRWLRRLSWPGKPPTACVPSAYIPSYQS
jgi:hypothetical protein